MYRNFDCYELGDLVILLETIEWDDVIAFRDEICMVVEIYDPEDEEQFFNYRILLGDGRSLDVWIGEIEKLSHEP